MNDKSFNLPKNIKQIGSVDPSLKVYIEDYAFTFMQQYSRENPNEDKIALLVGDECYIDGTNVLFISAVIKPKYTVFKNSMEVLTEKSFDYVQEQIDTYFQNLNVVGWFYSRAGFEKQIQPSYIKYHKETFFTDDKVLFLYDPLEKSGAFFNFSIKTEEFNELKGFIVYYERNEAMSEYMLNNQFNTTPELEEKKAKELKFKTEKIDTNNDLSTGKEKETKITKAKPTTGEVKKGVNIFGSLTAVLILISFVMGAGLIQSEDRISKLEEQFSKVDENYKYLLLQVTNQSVQSVFAESSYYEDLNSEIYENEITKSDYEENASSYEDSLNLEVLQDDYEEQTLLIQQQTSYDKLQNSQDNSEVLATTYQTYTIKDGDNLEKISTQFYGNIEKVKDIMLLNNIEDADKIYSGMSICLP